MLRDLLTRIDELGGGEGSPVVPLDLFFEGNDDEASFAPNLDPHPGIETVRGVLQAIEQRRDVSAVLVQIDEVLEPPEWPYASRVYVVTSAPAAEVHRWAAALEPDEVSPDERENDGWGDDGSAGAPPGAPDVPEGHRPVVLFWD